MWQEFKGNLGDCLILKASANRLLNYSVYNKNIKDIRSNEYLVVCLVQRCAFRFALSLRELNRVNDHLFVVLYKLPIALQRAIWLSLSSELDDCSYTFIS